MSSLVIMENVNLQAMSVTGNMTVKITVMKTDVVCDTGMLDYLYNYTVSLKLNVFPKHVHVQCNL